MKKLTSSLHVVQKMGHLKSLHKNFMYVHYLVQFSEKHHHNYVLWDIMNANTKMMRNLKFI